MYSIHQSLIHREVVTQRSFKEEFRDVLQRNSWKVSPIVSYVVCHDVSQAESMKVFGF